VSTCDTNQNPSQSLTTYPSVNMYELSSLEQITNADVIVE